MSLETLTGVKSRETAIAPDDGPPLVSMVIPSFNHCQYIRQCIASVIAQDYEHLELLIIDDGSVDESVDVIRSMIPLCEDRFERFEFRSRPNRGLSATLNEGLDWASGEYFAALASDDVLHSNKTSTLLARIATDATIAGVFSGCQLVDSSGATIARISPTSATYTFDDVITHKHVVVAPSQLLRLAAVRNVGGYPVGLHIEDWYMWLRLTERGHLLAVVPEQLVQYRRHEHNMSSDAASNLAARIWILEQFREHRLYPYALARTHISAAIDLSCTSRRLARRHLASAAALSARSVFTSQFASAATRLVLPCVVVSVLARVRSRLRRLTTRARRSW